MKRTLLTSTAFIALIAAPLAPAFAQDQAPADKPAVILPGDDVNSMDTDTMGSDTGETMTGEAPAEEVAPAAETTEMAEADDSMFFIYEEDNQYRSTKLVGHTVINGQDETLGDINDLVVSADGQLEGVIIGVGGFLGIGEKDVGVRFDALSISENAEAGDMNLVLDTTREELEAAPSFVTKEEQAANEQRKKTIEELGTDSGMTGAIAPVDPNATEPATSAAPAE